MQWLNCVAELFLINWTKAPFIWVVVYIWGIPTIRWIYIESHKHELNILDSLCTYYSNFGNVIIAGDLNAQDHDRSNKYKSIELTKFIDRHFLSYAGNQIPFKGPNYTYILTYLHTYILTYLLTYLHTYILTYLHTYILTYLHTYLHTYILTYLHTYILTYLLTYLHTYILTYLHTYVLTYLHTYLHTYILTYLHTYILTYLLTYLHTYILTYLHTYILTLLKKLCLIIFFLIKV